MDFKEELRLFLEAVKRKRPQPCPQPGDCDNFSCSENVGIIAAYDRAEKALAG